MLADVNSEVTCGKVMITNSLLISGKRSGVDPETWVNNYLFLVVLESEH
jgi:hypothetical protein